MKRKIIHIDEEKCNGCGLCIPNCPEGAIQVIDGKARLVSDLLCDGLGACLGTCPLGAIAIEEREAEAYDERQVMENMVGLGANTVKAHLAHLSEHGETEFLNQAIAYLKEHNIEIPDFDGSGQKEPAPAPAFHGGGCPGAAARDLRNRGGADRGQADTGPLPKQESQLRSWPIQLMLLNPRAPYLKGADLLVSADCVPFAYADFHQRFLKDRIMVTFCPKLDQTIEQYIDKLALIFETQDIKSVTVPHMEVPCCSGTVQIVQRAMEQAKKVIPLREYTIAVSGEIM